MAMSDSARIITSAEKQPAEFFMAIDAALLGSGSLYRVYPDDDRLILLRVGTYYGPLGVDVGRTVRGGNWLGSLAYAAKPLISGAAVFGSIILIILVRMMVRGKLPIGGALDVVLVFALLALFLGLLALWLIRRTVVKAKALDEL